MYFEVYYMSLIKTNNPFRHLLLASQAEESQIDNNFKSEFKLRVVLLFLIKTVLLYFIKQMMLVKLIKR